MEHLDTAAIVSQYVKRICPITHGNEINPNAVLARLAKTNPQLAADTILHPRIRGKLRGVVGYALRKLDCAFKSMTKEERGNAYETCIELALNLVGMESERIGFLPGERSRAFVKIVTTLAKWESYEREVEKSPRPVAADVVNRLLQNMKQVLSGKSMVARIAEQIDEEILADEMATSFVFLAADAIQSNVYYQMCSKDIGKFGNDSATGLRFVRHLGFVQVSSNPIIAARAYEEFPDLWNNFKEVVKANPAWLDDPAKFGDEITTHATLVSLLPNILAFRPIALLSGFRDGMVSYQLNPFHTESVMGSIRDAEYALFFLREILRQYDAWLGWSGLGYNGRPNVVFKVAASSATAREITQKLNRRGIGTNNTVTYSVSQELRLLVDAAEGMAGASKNGVPISQIYETNMIGRLEDHIRESEAERLLSTLGDQSGNLSLDELGEKLCGRVPQGTREEKLKTICAKKNLKSLTDETFFFSLALYYGRDFRTRLAELEEDIQHAGIFVTRRVWQLFFAPDARKKWTTYFEKKFEITSDQARAIMDRIDLLPASKRRSRDTYLVLGTPNATNTEFPDQQMKVFSESLGNNFDLAVHQNSISREPDPAILKRLLAIEDFRRAYELTPLLKILLRKVGIPYGDDRGRGLRPRDWSTFGVVRKTMDEFKNAYLAFREKVLDFVHIQCMTK